MEQEPKDQPNEQSGPDPALVWGDEAPIPILPENEVNRTKPPVPDKTIPKIDSQ